MLARVSLTTVAQPSQGAAPVVSSGPRGGWFGWLGPVGMAILAAILRLPNLGRPHAFVFDETYYAKDGLALLLFGHEMDAKKKANDLLLAMDGNLESAASVFKDTPSYVVHPPFGKWVIASGQAVFGADPFGWRIAVAIVGILSVLVLARVVRRLTGSNLLGTLAGFLMAIDGMAIVMSRTALLDGILSFLVLLAFAALLLDRDRARRIWPKRGLRPWRWAAALALGLACGVKWSGLWFVVAFGLLTVIWDLGWRRQLGERHAFAKTFLRDAVPAALIMLPIAFLTYLATWYGWFTSTGYLRTWAFDNGGYTGIQGALRSLAHYHAEAFRFHTGLTTEHSYQANAWGWPVLARPTSFHYESEGLQCGGAESCSQEVIALGNPVIWWAAVLALVHQVWRWVAVRDWRAGAVLCGFFAGWAPWLLFQERTVFSFYSIVFLPFMIMALTLSLATVLGRPDATRERRQNGAFAVLTFLLMAVAATWWFYPIWTGEVIPYSAWQLRMWLPTWV
jgi:dolichyl-phosphate-mannose--protein O-mannosyl transferase